MEIASFKNHQLPRLFPELHYSLRYLNLRNNQLHVFPNELLSLHSLEILDISKNLISSFPTSFGTLMRLKVLSVANNSITLLPDYVDDMAMLTVLNVKGNTIKWRDGLIFDISKTNWILAYKKKPPFLDTPLEVLCQDYKQCHARIKSFLRTRGERLRTISCRCPLIDDLVSLIYALGELSKLATEMELREISEMKRFDLVIDSFLTLLKSTLDSANIADVQILFFKDSLLEVQESSIAMVRGIQLHIKDCDGNRTLMGGIETDWARVNQLLSQADYNLRTHKESQSLDVYGRILYWVRELGRRPLDAEQKLHLFMARDLCIEQDSTLPDSLMELLVLSRHSDDSIVIRICKRLAADVRLLL